MDVLSLLRIVLRRWAVVGAVLLLTGLAAYQVVRGVQPTYEAHASVLVTGLATTDVAAAPEDGVSAVVSAPVLAEVVAGGTVRERLRDAGATAAFETQVDAEGGIVRIKAYDPADGKAALRTVEAVAQAIEQEAERRQEGLSVPDSQRVTAEILAQPLEATREQVPDPVTGSAGDRWVAEGSVVLVDPAPVANPYPATPYTVRVLEEIMSGPAVGGRLAERDARSPYEIVTDRRDAAPILYTVVTGSDPDNVVYTLEALLDEMSAQLTSRQHAAGVPPGARSTLDRIAVATVPTQVSSNLLRPLVMIVGVGVVTALSLAVLADGVLTTRRRRRGEPSAAPAGDWPARTAGPGNAPGAVGAPAAQAQAAQAPPARTRAAQAPAARAAGGAVAATRTRFVAR